MSLEEEIKKMRELLNKAPEPTTCKICGASISDIGLDIVYCARDSSISCSKCFIEIESKIFDAKNKDDA